jgi:hypothetical protein
MLVGARVNNSLTVSSCEEQRTIWDNNELISTKVGNYWSKNGVIKDGKTFFVNRR